MTGAEERGAGTRVVEAAAKVNLHLRVGARRPDGYHDVETVLQAISLSDTVEVAVERAVGPVPGETEVFLEVEGPDIGPPESNLAVRAARAFAARTGRPLRVHVRLTKRIPAGAGLGGGSSDAAAVLRCLAEITGVVEAPLLHEVAASLGADVPFFLGPGARAWGSGRGDVLTALPAPPSEALVVCLPPVHVSTAEAYAALGRGGGGGAPGTPGEASGMRGGARATAGDGELAALRTGGSLRDLRPLNDFQPAMAAAHPEIEASLAGLLSEGARWSLLSGSGGASFGLFDDERAAEWAAEALTGRLGWPCVTTRTLEVLPSPAPPNGG